MQQKLKRVKYAGPFGQWQRENPKNRTVKQQKKPIKERTK